MGSDSRRRGWRSPQMPDPKDRRRRAPETILFGSGKPNPTGGDTAASRSELSRERTLYVVNRAHEEFYASILAREPAQNILVQPSNRGTAPAILYSLLRIAAVDLNALVAFFPSDHYISDNDRFMAHIRTALDTARTRLDLVILLGLDPESPEIEYG